MNIPSLLLFTSLANMTGITVFAHYEQLQCDPLASGEVDSPNKVPLCPLHYFYLKKGQFLYSSLIIISCIISIIIYR